MEIFLIGLQQVSGKSEGVPWLLWPQHCGCLVTEVLTVNTNALGSIPLHFQQTHMCWGPPSTGSCVPG